MPSRTFSKIRKNPIKEKPVKFVIDLKQPVDDEVIEIKDVEDHIKKSFKINGKKSVQGVTITGAESTVIKS
jgi:flagellar hook assembly protein FlgD